jgi:CheY-like chemotaxis protein
MTQGSVEDRPRLLLIDDCVALRDLYELVLEREFEILTAARGAEGAALARDVQPDAIVLDITMPGMDGWETCELIKCHDLTAHIPVILLTGAEDGDLAQRATAVGASALLRKPCQADVLRETIFATLAQP